MKMIAFLVVAGSITASACAPLHAPPVLSHSEGAQNPGLEGAIQRAGLMGQTYLNYADDSAIAANVFELPVVGGAIAAASFLAFGAHPDAALAASIVGASAGAASSLYSPRKKAGIYADGAVASYCLRSLAVRAIGSLDFIDRENAQSYLIGAGVSPASLALKINHSLDDVGIAIFKRQLSETEPDIDAIVASIKASIQAGNGAEAGAVAMAARSDDPEPGIGKDHPEVQFLIRFDEAITPCKTKAGTV